MNTPQSTAVAIKPQDPINSRSNFEVLLKKYKQQFAVTLGKSINPDHFIRAALTACNKQPLLFRCTAMSVMTQLLDLAELGLTASGANGEAWLVPFNNKGTYEATLIIGYKGYVKLMRRANTVQNLHADIVTEDDHFEIEYGSNNRLVHRPALGKPRNDMSRWMGAYAYIQYKDRGEDFVFVPRERIEKVRNISRAKDSGPWRDWPDSMWTKTAIRQLKNVVSLTSEVEDVLEKAMSLDSSDAIDVDASVSQEAKPSQLLDTPPAAAKRSPGRPRRAPQSAQEPPQEAEATIKQPPPPGASEGDPGPADTATDKPSPADDALFPE